MKSKLWLLAGLVLVVVLLSGCDWNWGYIKVTYDYDKAVFANPQAPDRVEEGRLLIVEFPLIGAHSGRHEIGDFTIEVRDINNTPIKCYKGGNYEAGVFLAGIRVEIPNVGYKDITIRVRLKAS